MKERIYLDTNIILGWFKIKMQSERDGREFFIPERLESLLEKNHELFVSTLVKAEIFRYLVSEWQLQSHESESLWAEFIKTFGVEELRFDFLEVDLKIILKISGSVPLKKNTIVDLMHIQISEKLDLRFYTDEEDLKTKLKSFYDFIIIVQSDLDG